MRIAFEGFDGVGKSTFIKHYTDMIKTPFRIFHIPIDIFKFTEEPLDAQIDYILKLRHAHIDEALRLEAEDPSYTIIFDRWYPSLYVYQGVGIDVVRLPDAFLNPKNFEVDVLVYIGGKVRLDQQEIEEFESCGKRFGDGFSIESCINHYMDRYDIALKGLSCFAKHITIKSNESLDCGTLA